MSIVTLYIVVAREEENKIKQMFWNYLIFSGHARLPKLFVFGDFKDDNWLLVGRGNKF
jgi:hypothetical protein